MRLLVRRRELGAGPGLPLGHHREEEPDDVARIIAVPQIDSQNIGPYTYSHGRDRPQNRHGPAELDDISAARTDTIHEHLEELDDAMRTWTLQSTRANLGVMVQHRTETES